MGLTLGVKAATASSPIVDVHILIRIGRGTFVIIGIRLRIRSVTGITDVIPIGIGLIGIGHGLTVIADIAYPIAVAIGLIGIGIIGAIIGGIAGIGLAEIIGPEEEIIIADTVCIGVDSLFKGGTGSGLVGPKHHREGQEEAK
jgi:hypothetical protein